MIGNENTSEESWGLLDAPDVVDWSQLPVEQRLARLEKLNVIQNKKLNRILLLLETSRMGTTFIKWAIGIAVGITTIVAAFKVKG